MKGSGFLATYQWVARHYKPEDLEKVAAALKEDRKELFANPILSVDWYDYNAYFRWITAVDKILGKGDFKLVEAAAVGSAKDAFKSIYKFFISLTNPHFILNNASLVWKQIFDEGDVQVEWPGPKYVIIKLSKVIDMPLRHELDHVPSLEEVTRLSGGNNVCSRHVQCLARGDDACWFEMEWD